MSKDRMTLEQIGKLQALYEEVFGGRKHLSFFTLSRGDTEVQEADADGGEVVAECPYRCGVADLIAEMLDALLELPRLAKQRQRVAIQIAKLIQGPP